MFCLAAGQLGLMSLYSTLFATHSVNIAQILVTADDFQSPTQRQNLVSSMERMLQLQIVPIINENDAGLLFWRGVSSFFIEPFFVCSLVQPHDVRLGLV